MPTRNLHIAHVVEAWNGGVGTIVDTLMRGQIAGGQQVSLLYDPAKAVLNFDAAAYRDRGISLHPYRSSRNPLAILGCALRIRTILRDARPDIIHLHSSFAGVYGRVFKPCGNVIYCPHGWGFAQEDNRFKRAVYALIERSLAVRGDGILCVSAPEKRSAIAVGIAPDTLHVVPNGVRDAIDGPPAIVPNPDKLNLLFIGRDDRKKGFDLLYNFMQTQAPPHLHLYVIGDHTGYADRANVTFAGWVGPDRVDSYIKAADCLIAPSRYEAFGLTVLEAFRNGVPAIVSHHTAMADLVDTGESGFLVDIDDFPPSLNAILNDLSRERLRDTGAKARKVYEQHYTAAHMIEKTQSLYHHICHPERATEGSDPFAA
ncbi:MAG: glycosyltransferase [Bdellovibrionales bacterium]